MKYEYKPSRETIQMWEEAKLLAQFAGFTMEKRKFQYQHYHSSNEASWEWSEGDIVVYGGHEYPDPNNEPYGSLEDLPFIHDWGLLMLVVSKIEESNEYEVDIFGNCCHISNILDNSYPPDIECAEESKTEAVYQAVVRFVKWYNGTK